MLIGGVAGQTVKGGLSDKYTTIWSCHTYTYTGFRYYHKPILLNYYILIFQCFIYFTLTFKRTWIHSFITEARGGITD